jgi:hypothetical protein
VLAVLGFVYERHPEPVPWDELVDELSGHYSWRTIDATVYDALAFGALHRVGKPAQRGRPDTRALRSTPLGRAWLDAELLPLPGKDPE